MGKTKRCENRAEPGGAVLFLFRHPRHRALRDPVGRDDGVGKPARGAAAAGANVAEEEPLRVAELRKRNVVLSLVYLLRYVRMYVQ